MPSFFIIRTVLLLLAGSGFSFMPAPAESKLTVSITNLTNDKGHVLVSLYNTAEGFPSKPEKAVQKRRVTITNKQASVEFSAVPAGTYAVAVLHDENDDQKMNTNWLGIPKEGYGFSNNVTGTLGPPPFSKASFIVEKDEQKSISIRLRH